MHTALQKNSNTDENNKTIKLELKWAQNHVSWLEAILAIMLLLLEVVKIGGRDKLYKVILFGKNSSMRPVGWWKCTLENGRRSPYYEQKGDEKRTVQNLGLRFSEYGRISHYLLVTAASTNLRIKAFLKWTVSRNHVLSIILSKNEQNWLPSENETTGALFFMTGIHKGDGIAASLTLFFPGEI